MTITSWSPWDTTSRSEPEDELDVDATDGTPIDSTAAADVATADDATLSGAVAVDELERRAAAAGSVGGPQQVGPWQIVKTDAKLFATFEINPEQLGPGVQQFAFGPAQGVDLQIQVMRECGGQSGPGG